MALARNQGSVGLGWAGKSLEFRRSWDFGLEVPGLVILVVLNGARHTEICAITRAMLLAVP